MASDASDDDDEDYRPPSDDEHSSDEIEAPVTKKARLSPEAATEDKAKADEIRQAVWAEFQASLAGPSQPPKSDVKMVEIEKKYKFAGKDITEKKLVPEDSQEAKEWLAARSAPADDSSAAASSTEQPQDSETAPPEPVGTPSKPLPPLRRPGPRKPRVDLSSTKPKKLTMLQKSAMDWSAHLAQTDKTVKEELEANRRSGGALAKRDFLDRVDIRKQQEAQQELGKRRRK